MIIFLSCVPSMGLVMIIFRRNVMPVLVQYEGNGLVLSGERMSTDGGMLTLAAEALVQSGDNDFEVNDALRSSTNDNLLLLQIVGCLYGRHEWYCFVNVEARVRCCSFASSVFQPLHSNSRRESLSTIIFHCQLGCALFSLECRSNASPTH